MISLLSKLMNQIIPYSCVLCHQKSNNNFDLCHKCEHQMAINRQACQCCAIPIEGTALVCGKCQQHPPFFQQSFIPFIYQDPIRHLILQLKFHEKLYAAKILGHLLATQIKQNNKALPELIIPVPLHPTRQKQRGFNQTIEISRFLSHKLNIQMDNSIIIKEIHTQPQIDLSRIEREKNLANVFSVKKTPVAQHIAIVDDVVTTGHTVNQIAKLLQSTGVEKIDVWAIARTVT